ncbi:MAG: hypothetical protein H6719_16505 [Sandaracinaceae bacterium]|nr:hypothetical protein [Sandaracinaceae bacterium]
MTTTEERIEALRAELEATADSGRRAVVQYEIGHLAQHELGNEAQAVREYLQAYNHDPQFRPPLIALVALFERRRSTKNLLRLYDAEARSATNAREAASALANRAVLMSDQLEEADESLKLFKTAFEQAAEAPDLALLLEHELLSRGQTKAALEITAARADMVNDPNLSSLLRLEVARAKEADGDIDGAIAAVRGALATPAARWRALSELERITRAADRPNELAATLEALGKLARAAGRGEDRGQQSGAFAIQRFEDEAAASARAAALFREAARLRNTVLADPEGARRLYDEALGVQPNDPLLRYERMLACELAGDVDAAAEEATRFLEAGAEGALAASLHFRLAEQAQAQGDSDRALEALRAGLAADPGSVVIRTMLDDLVRATGELKAAHAGLLDAAGRAEGDAKAFAFWEAGDLAAYQLGDAEAARLGYLAAAEAAKDPTPMLREGFAASLRLGDAEGAKRFVDALLARELDDEERGALLRDSLELTRLVLEDREAGQATMQAALEAQAARQWAPDLARIGAAADDDLAMLARAHKMLAERSADDETTAAHLCAAARAQARAGDDDAAVESLRAALVASPSHPYAMALLEEVLRARGDAEEVVRLLREAAEQSDKPRAAETRLLLAGAAAEAADDFDRAVQTYEEAAERSPFSLAPVLAIRRMAEAQNDSALLLRALEGLSQREIASGSPGRHTLALAEHYDLISGKPELAEEPLREALRGKMALAAAVDLALVPIHGGDATRLSGLSRLLERAGPEAKPGMLREAAGAALAVGDHERAQALITELRDVAPRDRWASLGALRLAALDPTKRAARADAWKSLGRATDDPAAAAELINHGLRAQAMSDASAESDAVDDAVMVAYEVVSMAPESLHSAVALDEALSAGDDPEGRAEAMTGWAAHAGAAGRASLDLAHGRALAAAGRPQDALALLLKVAATDADDLASWDAIRVCARDAGAWEPLVEACDRMAHLVEDDELKMVLWEESAAVLMDALHQDDRAERRLRRVLAIDARRPIAYGRLHDLLAEREDDQGLLGLVTARIALLDDPEELTKLYYEQARLLRSIGLREEALNSLDNLLMLDESHVGGLALMVEVQVQAENWRGAVDALQMLAGADDVPGGQRRIARLGAADFLDNRLGDTEGALAELGALHAAGLADLEIYERMATLAERLGQHDAAVEALGHAVENAPSANIAARLERRAGALHAEERLDVPAAIDAYQRALALTPIDVRAGESLAKLLQGDQRVQMSLHFERSLRQALGRDPLDAKLLRSLARAGAWREDGALQDAVLGILVAVGLANEQEIAAWRSMPPRFAPHAALDDAGLAQLATHGMSSPAHRLAVALAESAEEMDGLEPSGFGLGRGDQVKTDTPLRSELRLLSGMFGLPEAELFQGGSEPQRLDLAPRYKGKATWIAGPGVGPGLTPDQRFTAGWLALGARLGVTPFVRRGPMGAAIAIFAAADAAESPLPAGQGRPAMEDTKKRMYKAMPRRVRKSLPELLAALGDDGRSIDMWTLDLSRTVHRGGLLAANDPAVGLGRVLGRAPDPESVRASGDALDLVYFWLSPECCALRRRLGLVS